LSIGDIIKRGIKTKVGTMPPRSYYLAMARWNTKSVAIGLTGALTFLILGIITNSYFDFVMAGTLFMMTLCPFQLARLNYRQAKAVEKKK